MWICVSPYNFCFNDVLLAKYINISFNVFELKNIDNSK